MEIHSIDEVVAKRKYTLATTTAPSEIELAIDKPFPSTEVQDGMEYICPFSISRDGATKFHYAAGIDALQALLLGLAMVKVRLEALSAENRGSLTWLAGEPGALGIYIQELSNHR